MCLASNTIGVNH